MTHSFDYQKPEAGRQNLGRVVGEGVLIAEGDVHRRQRRVMNPGFGPAQIRELTPIFLQKAEQLRDAWLREAGKTGGTQPVRLDALSWLSRTTLDIIGLAGFDYSFDSLDGGNNKNELNEAFATMFRASESARILSLFITRIPLLRFIVRFVCHPPLVDLIAKTAHRAAPHYHLCTEYHEADRISAHLPAEGGLAR
jgi:hypothetical protein